MLEVMGILSLPLFVIVMRKDIKINTDTGEIIFDDYSKSKKCSFKWLNEDDLYIYGQVTVSENVDIKELQEGITVDIPYTPVYKKIKIKIIKTNNTGTSSVLNQIDGTEWFELNCKLHGANVTQPRASELIVISNMKYSINIIDYQAFVWSSSENDMICENANNQNKALMLKCVPGNCYRYPVTGVGIVRYLHANLSHTDLADRLQSEFQEDKVMVNNASFDTETGNIELDLDFSEADADI